MCAYFHRSQERLDPARLRVRDVVSLSHGRDATTSGKFVGLDSSQFEMFKTLKICEIFNCRLIRKYR